MKHAPSIEKARMESTPPKQSPSFARLVIGCVAGVGLLVGTIVGTTFFQQGFVAAGRCATELVMPVSLAWLTLFAVSLGYFGSRRRERAAFFFFLFLIWSILGNGHFVKWMMARVESPLVAEPHPAFEKRFTVAASVAPDRPIAALDAVVTLGGSANLVMLDFPEINAEGERIVSAAQAYHAGAVRTIVTTGTAFDAIGNPSEVSRELLVSLGVPADRIFQIEGQNTTQEMRSLATFLKEPPESWSALLPEENRSNPVVGLITSAFHMPRAMRLSKTAGLDLIPLPCAFRTQRIRRPWVASNLVPTAGNLNELALAIKESMAFLLGR